MLLRTRRENVAKHSKRLEIAKMLFIVWKTQCRDDVSDVALRLVDSIMSTLSWTDWRLNIAVHVYVD